MYTHICQCGSQYENEDPDPYYCDACVASRKAIADEIDAKRRALGPVPKPMSALELFDAAADSRGFAKASQIL